jgi:tRNA(fMet)-specific endonuclease VapC
MNLLYDTNILLAVVRAANHPDILNLINPKHNPAYVSIVSEGEIKSLAMQNQWGMSRIAVLENMLDQVTIIDITKDAIKTYTQIDSYSQLRNPGFDKYPFMTPRNMGKNDLWIASLAAYLGLKLITTDSDFDHLHDVFFDVRKIDQSEFVPFFGKN